MKDPKVHSTNYFSTFIQIAEDCMIDKGREPKYKPDVKSVANLQFEILARQPYKFTSDEVLFEVHCIRNDISNSERKEMREKFFSKGQPCFRASPLTKLYGWGVHFNEEGKMALVPCESDEYADFLTNPKLKQLKAMKRSRN